MVLCMNLRLDTDAIRYISLFESLTGATVKDCLIDEDGNKLIMVVKKGHMGLAIGKKGSNINRVKKLLGKDIQVVEHSHDAREFLENLLHPIRVKNVQILSRNNKKWAYVEVLARDKAIAIGKNGKNIRKIKLLMQRNLGIDNVVIK
ncbi:MAG: Transcription antitermination factor NusA [Candidatus Alkanophagales archaeon MCA70_species_1]|nr:Transcription antitermination factor NusA [Candidatus Alkanophaga volatiphilum]